VTSKGKIAALVADAFQEEEYFFPKLALNEADYQVEVVCCGFRHSASKTRVNAL
jgi:hypothetical protein